MPLGEPYLQPIFILGIMPRCGTNFLSNLLLLHPDCVAPATVWEDYSNAHADLLESYSDHVSSHWNPKWGVTEQTRMDFDAALGSGISTFLAKGAEEKRVVAKTPEVKNLDLFFRFFPHARLIILIRDGRAIVESGMRSFGWNREAALHWLSGAAGSILKFTHQNPHSEYNYRIISYEQLWQEPENTLRELLDFLDLDADDYDFTNASQLPLRGSSDLLAEDSTALHWDPVERDAKFDPLSRYEHWNTFMHYRYQQVAGKHMEALGYENKDRAAPSFLHWFANQLLDLAWQLKSALRPLYRRLQRQKEKTS